ncbi:hypothetical protein C4577_05010 [Candidatus Parcubacteria bacterium]|nr:MAG: hypothetical protein C4577_05010 [Candidatus Parcubacteria bacterium]
MVDKPIKCSAGTEVEVFDIKMKFLGYGILLFDYDSEDEDTPMPEIKLENGEILLGCECWWIPSEEAEKIKKKVLGAYKDN